jgi:hypothetical protein
LAGYVEEDFFAAAVEVVDVSHWSSIA